MLSLGRRSSAFARELIIVLAAAAGDGEKLEEGETIEEEAKWEKRKWVLQYAEQLVIECASFDQYPRESLTDRHIQQLVELNIENERFKNA